MRKLNNVQSQILQSFSDALVEIVRSATPSVVQVRSARGFGSGIVWDDEGHLVTNSHVVGRAGRIEVSFPEGDTLAARVIGQDRFSDIAVLKVDVTGKGSPKPITRDASEMLSVGQFVLALANPFGAQVSASSGIITNPRARLGGPWADDVIITDVRLNRGYSGGPLIDVTGKLIGMNAAVFANRGIAIPLNVLATVVKELSTSGSVKRAYLGVVSNPITLPNELAKEIGQNEGLLVLSVEAGTPAKRAGIAIGDIIVSVDSQRVESYHDLHRILTGGIVGRDTKLSILRGEKLNILSIIPVAT